MPDDAAPAAGAENGTGGASAPSEATDQKANIEGLRALFATLVPPERMTLRDAFGGEHVVRTTLSARAQIALLHEIEALSDLSIDMGRFLAAARAEDVRGMARSIVGIATDERVIAALGRAFALAHPKTVTQAGRAAVVSGDVDQGELEDPLALFPLEELVAGLVPFCIRFATRSANLWEQVTGPTAERQHRTSSVPSAS